MLCMVIHIGCLKCSEWVNRTFLVFIFCLFHPNHPSHLEMHLEITPLPHFKHHAALPLAGKRGWVEHGWAINGVIVKPSGFVLKARCDVKAQRSHIVFYSCDFAPTKSRASAFLFVRRTFNWSNSQKDGEELFLGIPSHMPIGLHNSCWW